MKWISVKDNLPKSNTKVLAYDEIEGIYTAIYHIRSEEERKYPETNSYKYTFWQFDSGNDICCHCNDPDMDNVKFWMPLPDKPTDTKP